MLHTKYPHTENQSMDILEGRIDSNVSMISNAPAKHTTARPIQKDSPKLQGIIKLAVLPLLTASSERKVIVPSEYEAHSFFHLPVLFCIQSMPSTAGFGGGAWQEKRRD